MQNLNQKWVLITGGSSGIGLALAKCLAAEGAHLAILARREDVLSTAVDQIRSFCPSPEQQIIPLCADVARLDSILPVLEEFLTKYAAPDILINSAGITYPGNFHELDYDIFRSIMEVNYLGTVNVTRALINSMLARGSGHIVNISSMAGVIGTYGYSAYGGSKFAIRGFSDVLRAEYKNRGIRVSVVFPPDTETPQLEFEKDLKPAVTQALSDSAGVMKAEDVARIIWRDMQRGRYTIIPGLSSWFLYFLVGHLGDFTYTVMDWMINYALRSINRRRK